MIRRDICVEMVSTWVNGERKGQKATDLTLKKKSCVFIDLYTPTGYSRALLVLIASISRKFMSSATVKTEERNPRGIPRAPFIVFVLVMVHSAHFNHIHRQMSRNISAGQMAKSKVH
jgi:hypothetical protein